MEILVTKNASRQHFTPSLSGANLSEKIMREVKIIFFLLFFTFSIQSQSLMIGDYNLPANNSFVQKGLLAIKYLNNGEIDSLASLNTNSELSLDTLNFYLPFFLKGYPLDTSLVEYFGGHDRSEFSYCVNYDSFEKGVVYYMKITTTKNSNHSESFSIEFERNTNYWKTLKDLESLPPPKSK